jgi:hypothetical protein
MALPVSLRLMNLLKNITNKTVTREKVIETLDKGSLIKKEEMEFALQYLGMKMKENMTIEGEKSHVFNTGITSFLKINYLKEKIILKNTNLSLFGGNKSFDIQLENARKNRLSRVTKAKLELLIAQSENEVILSRPKMTKIWKNINRLLNNLLLFLVKNKAFILTLGLLCSLLFTIFKNHSLLMTFISKYLENIKNRSRKLQKECRFPENNNTQDIWLMDSPMDHCPDGSTGTEHY